MVARRQANDERAQLAGVEAGRHDARGVVALAGRTAHALVGVRREESAAGDATLEGQADRRTIRLVAGVGGRIGGRRLEERPANRMPVLVEHQQVRRERIGLREFAAPRGVLVVLAAPRQTGARLDDQRLEAVRAGLHERQAGGEIQVAREDLNLESLGHDNVFALAGVVEHALAGAGRVAGRGNRGPGKRSLEGRRKRSRRERHHQHQRQGQQCAAGNEPSHWGPFL